MFCNYCGEENPDDSSFCGSCGRRIGRVAAPTAPRPEADLQQPKQPIPQESAAQPMQQAPASQQPTALWLALAAAGLAVVTLVVVLNRDTAPNSEVPPPPESGSPPALPDVALASPTPPPPQTIPEPAIPTDPLVGRWKTSLLVGDGYLTFTEDGRIHIENLLSDEWGIYVFSDGDLEIQKDSYFSHVVVHWRAQLSGNSLRVIEPEGASHVYERVDGPPSDAGAASEPSIWQQLAAELVRQAESPSPAPPAEGEGRFEDLAAILKDAVTGAGAPKPLISTESYAITSFALQVCAPASVVEKASWSSWETERAQGVRAAVRQLLSSHRFRDPSAAEGSAGQVTRAIRVTESALDQYDAIEVSDEETECRGDYYTWFPVDLGSGALASPTSTTDGGFGDLLGEGGFIEPLQD